MLHLSVRIARNLNTLWERDGPVLADRHHAQVLRTAREVRHTLAYVLCNSRKHGCRLTGIDPDATFDGWKHAPTPHVTTTSQACAPPVAVARS